MGLNGRDFVEALGENGVAFVVAPNERDRKVSDSHDDVSTVSLP